MSSMPTPPTGTRGRTPGQGWDAPLTLPPVRSGQVAAVVAVLVTVLIIALVVLILAASRMGPPRNNHPGNAQPPPVGAVLLGDQMT